MGDFHCAAQEAKQSFNRGQSIIEPSIGGLEIVFQSLLTACFSGIELHPESASVDTPQPEMRDKGTRC